MPRTVKAIVEDADCATDAGEDAEVRDVHFHASFALRIEVPINYMSIMANRSVYNASHVYRFSYKLFPQEEKTVIEVAFFGPVAKLYCKDQTICLKVYEDTGCVWVAWSKPHTIKLTDESLINLFDYVCDVTVSEAGERVILDRPKGFRVPDVFYESLQFMKTYSHWLETPVESNWGTPVAVLEEPELYVDVWEKLSKMSVKSIDVENVPPWQEIDEIILSQKTETSSEMSLESSEETSSGSPFVERLIVRTSCGLQPPTSFNYKLLWSWIVTKSSLLEDSEYFQTMDDIPKRSAGGDAAEDIANVKLKRFTKLQTESKQSKKRIAEVTILPILQIKMQAFFTGISAQVVQMDQRQNPSTLANAVFLVSVEDDLMSLQQKIVYNPLSVKLMHVEDLPKLDPSILPEGELIDMPVFLKYKLLNQKSRRTKPQPYNTEKVVWKDSQVYLLGTMSPAKIRELFSGPPLMVELHDRDNPHTLKNMSSPNPAVFGSEKTDRHICAPILAERKLLNINPFYLDPPYSTYGVAQLNMSEFLHGRTQVEFCEQVMSSVIQKRRQIAVEKYIKCSSNPDDIYLNAGTALEAKLSLCVPLFNPTLATFKECSLLPRPYFARLIVKFDSSEKAFLYQLMKTVAGINATQLRKNGFPSVYCLGLMMPLLPVIERAKQSLDIVTGVHICDSTFHVFYLEGQAAGCMRTLWKRLLSITDFNKIKILYNSAMIFGERMYLLLPTFLCHLYLRLSLKKLLCSRCQCRFDLSGAEDECQKGLQNIYRLNYCDTLEDVTRNSLFPTKNMILSMSQKVGCMMTTAEITKLLAPTDAKSRYRLQQPINKSPKKLK